MINNVSHRCDTTGSVPTCEGTVNFLRPPGALSFEMVGAGIVDAECSGSSCRFEYAGLLPATLGVVAVGNGGRSEPALFEIS